jgi:pimeloyl-ACP methyl ester carboxylesterase
MMTKSVQEVSRPGTAGTVIALHCSLGSGNQWARLSEELAATHRVITPDISGYGNNPGPFDLPTTLSEEVGLLENGLREAVGPIHLVGHSYGGALAFKIATDSSLAGRVRSLTLIEPVLPTILRENGPDRPLYEHFVRLANGVREDLWNGRASEAIDKFLVFWKGSDARDISPKARMRMIEYADKLAFDFTAVLAEQNVTEAAAAIRAPALLVSGGLSPYFTQRILWRLTSAIPEVRTRHVPAAGHMLPVSHPELINPDILRHILRADELAGLSPASEEFLAEADAS